jgi:hypothetical protein
LNAPTRGSCGSGACRGNVPDSFMQGKWTCGTYDVWRGWERGLSVKGGILKIGVASEAEEMKKENHEIHNETMDSWVVMTARKSKTKLMMGEVPAGRCVEKQVQRTTKFCVVCDAYPAKLTRHSKWW